MSKQQESVDMPAVITLIAAAAALLAGCAPPAADTKRLDNLEAKVARLEAEAAKAQGGVKVEPPELGQQMLELQLRHARLWAAGQGEDWTLVLFQVAELRETAAEIVATNAEHPALQPARLADVMPGFLDPAFKALIDASDHADRAAFERAYDQLSAGCNACHVAASHDFLVIGRPTTPMLDNLKPTRSAR